MQNRKDRLGNVITTMDDMDLSTLSNICRVASERFKDHAKDFRKLIDYKPKEGEQKGEDGQIFIDMTPHGDGAKRLAEQFDGQADEALKFADLFADADMAEVINPPEEAEDAA